MAGSSGRNVAQLYLWLGLILLILAALFIGVGAAIGMADLSAVLCVPTGIIPGIIFAAVGMKKRKRAQELVEFASWVKSYRRIPMADVARKLGKSEFETDKILVDVVDRGLVVGFIDRKTNEFVLKEEIGREQYIEGCKRCGASLKKMYPLGETVLCPYCGSVILQAPTAQPAPPPAYYPPPAYGAYPPPYGGYPPPPPGVPPPPPP